MSSNPGFSGAQATVSRLPVPSTATNGTLASTAISRLGAHSRQKQKSSWVSGSKGCVMEGARRAGYSGSLLILSAGLLAFGLCHDSGTRRRSARAVL